MSFNINPCKAVLQKTNVSSNDINTINNLCYEITNAYGKAYGSTLKSELDKQCHNLIYEKKCQLGYDPRDPRRRPTPPPIFNQVPHYFPTLLKQTNNPHKAYEECSKLCQNCKYPNDCQAFCQLDYDALEIEHYDNSSNSNKKEHYDSSRSSNSKKEHKKIDYDGYKKSHPVVFFIGYVFVSCLFLLLVWFFISSLIKNR